jgi:crotonobetainyl-CoA hydratase
MDNMSASSYRPRFEGAGIVDSPGPADKRRSDAPCLSNRGGVEIVAACDLAIAADPAEFALSEPRVGLAVLGGGARQRLARDLPLKHAMGVVLRVLRIPAEEARRIGLANAVVPGDQLIGSARALADELLECAPLAFQASKQVMLQSLQEPDVEGAMTRRYEAAERMLASDDAREGPGASAEKRKPVWTGR